MPREVIAARFHSAVMALIADGCTLLCDRHGPATVALSGGVFQNLLLAHGAAAVLEAYGFRVRLHSRVPCNDCGGYPGTAISGRPPQGPPG